MFYPCFVLLVDDTPFLEFLDQLGGAIGGFFVRLI